MNNSLHTVRMVGPFMVGLLLLSSLSSSCSKNKEVIPEKQLVSLLADLEIARMIQRQPVRTSDFSNYDSVSLAVLRYHNISPEQLDTTLGWYGRNVDDYQLLYAKVEKELDRRQNDITEIQHVEKNEEGLKDLWPSNRFIRFSDHDLTSGFTFNIDNPDIEPGEILEWRMRPASGSNLEIILGGEYSGGDLVYNVSTLFSRQTTDVKLYTDSTRKLSRVYGIIRPTVTGGEKVMIDSISLMVLPKDPDQYFRSYHQKKYSIARKNKNEGKKISSAESDSTLSRTEK